MINVALQLPFSRCVVSIGFISKALAAIDFKAASSLEEDNEPCC